MKKIIALFLAITLVFICAAALVSCSIGGDKDDKDDKATKLGADGKKSEGYLLAAGYDAEYTTDPEYLENQEMEGLVGILEAERGNTLEGLDVLFAFYFDSKESHEASKGMLDQFFARLKLQAAELELEVETGSSDTVSWFGTKNAIKIAAGEKVTGGSNDIPAPPPEDDKTPGGGNVDVNLPLTDPERALECFLESNYMAEVTTDEEYLARMGMNGLVAVLEAESLGDDIDAIFIFYFESEEALAAARDVLDPLLLELKRDAAADDVEIELGTTANIAWAGTATAIRIAGGEIIDGG